MAVVVSVISPKQIILNVFVKDFSMVQHVRLMVLVVVVVHHPHVLLIVMVMAFVISQRLVLVTRVFMDLEQPIAPLKLHVTQVLVKMEEHVREVRGLLIHTHVHALLDIRERIVLLRRLPVSPPIHVNTVVFVHRPFLVNTLFLVIVKEQVMMESIAAFLMLDSIAMIIPSLQPSLQMVLVSTNTPISIRLSSIAAMQCLMVRAIVALQEAMRIVQVRVIAALSI